MHLQISGKIFLAELFTTNETFAPNVFCSHETAAAALFPANFHLDEDVFRLGLQKKSWRRLQDVFIKTNIFPLIIRLQKTSLRSTQDLLIKTKIFVLAIRLQEVFITSSRRLAKMSSRRWQLFALVKDLPR